MYRKYGEKGFNMFSHKPNNFQYIQNLKMIYFVKCQGYKHLQSYLKSNINFLASSTC